jgi:protein subunit release factor B
LNRQGALPLAIRPEKIKALEERFKALGIEERDILEKFVRAQGRGGQKVNKTSSCVYLRHIPTGIEVKCQTERSQAMNRFFARRILADKVEEMKDGPKTDARKRIRKQKQKRAKRVREKASQRSLSAREDIPATRDATSET